MVGLYDVSTCVCVQLHVLVCMHARRSGWHRISIFITTQFVLRQCISLSMDLVSLAPFAVQLALGGPCMLLKHWDAGLYSACPEFIWVLGIQSQFLTFPGQVFYSLSYSPRHIQLLCSTTSQKKKKNPISEAFSNNEKRERNNMFTRKEKSLRVKIVIERKKNWMSRVWSLSREGKNLQLKRLTSGRS